MQKTHSLGRAFCSKSGIFLSMPCIDRKLEPKDFRGLHEIIDIQQSHNLAYHVTGRRIVMVAAVGKELVHISSQLAEIFEVDKGAGLALQCFYARFSQILPVNHHSQLVSPIVMAQHVIQPKRHESVVGIAVLKALLQQPSFHIRQIVDDAAHILKDVIPLGLFHVYLIGIDIAHLYGAFRRAVAEVIAPFHYPLQLFPAEF